MSLEYYEKAHTSIISNIDLEWQLTCLKHFISELCNQNRTSQLVTFDYGHLHQDVLKILYERANRSDLRTHDFYNIIYSLHIKYKDYLKAAYSMLESASRLRKELTGIQSLKRQEKCYLACLNVLELVDKKYAWIARPTFSSTTNNVLVSSKSSPIKKRSIEPESNEIDTGIDTQIIDIEEINKNYMATHYMVKLSAISQSQSSNQFSSDFYNTDEIIGSLIKFGLFDDAAIACKLFKGETKVASMAPLFIGLVDRCCPSSSNEGKELFQSEFDFAKNNYSIEGYSPFEK